VIEAPLALAFGAGMLATVNPCGFPLLPAYLSYFLGLDADGGEARSARVGVARSLAVGATVASGFLIVFLVAGLALSHLSAGVYEWAPWLTIVIGIGLALLGIAMLRGFELTVALPRLQRGGDARTTRSMALFGVSYAIASLSCALPTFMVVVAGTFRRENLISSALTFVAYAAGMAVVLLALTVSMGLARQSLLRWLRRAMPYVSRVAGGLLLVAGTYVAYYGWYEIRVRRGDLSGSAAVDLVTGWSTSISRWVFEDVGAERLGLLMALGLAAVLAATYGLRARRRLGQ
jgi:cytochrome c biogenesis protein CcdA